MTTDLIDQLRLTKTAMLQKPIIGSTDRLTFPDLELTSIMCKIDTGAETSSIHCHDFQILNKILRCKFLDPEHQLYNDKELIFDCYSEKKIKNSFGKSEKRFVITTTVKLFGNTIPIDLTLADRATMQFPILIGKRFLGKNKLLVDVNKRYLSYKWECQNEISRNSQNK